MLLTGTKRDRHNNSVYRSETWCMRLWWR